MIIFKHHKREIGVEENAGDVNFLAKSGADLDLALYYIESRSNAEVNRITAQKVESLKKAGSTERFLSGEFDNKHVAHANFHYILLKSDMQHSFGEIATRYKTFFRESKDQRKRIVKFLDIDYEVLSRLAAIPGFGQEGREGLYRQFNNGEFGDRITSVMFHAERFTPGLKNLFGYDSKTRVESPLIERIFIE